MAKHENHCIISLYIVLVWNIAWYCHSICLSVLWELTKFCHLDWLFKEWSNGIGRALGILSWSSHWWVNFRYWSASLSKFQNGKERKIMYFLAVHKKKAGWECRKLWTWCNHSFVGCEHNQYSNFIKISRPNFVSFWIYIAYACLLNLFRDIFGTFIIIQ